MRISDGSSDVCSSDLDDEERTLLADLTKEGERVVCLRGGDGGRGNASYKSSTNRAPRQHGPGWPGEEMWVWLRLKLLADAGLVGLPNAGKSTFINAVTNAQAKVGAYAFTTTRPQLGVVSHKGREFVIADIPGLIEGAADGAGIGDRFLGHIERRSEEHTSELQSLMRISYAVCRWKKEKYAIQSHIQHVQYMSSTHHLTNM